MEDFFKVGIITSTHGVHGEVNVFPTTDDPKRFKKLKEVLLDTGKDRIPVEVEGCKFSKNMVILKLKGYDNPDVSNKLRQSELWVDRAHAVRLSKDEYYVADLIGMTVVDEEERPLGILIEVIETGANDVYEIELCEERKDAKNTEILVPAIKECILTVDLENNTMKIHVMEGMLES